MFKNIALIICFVIVVKAYYGNSRNVQFNGRLNCDNQPMENQKVSLYKNSLVPYNPLLGKSETNYNGEVAIHYNNLYLSGMKLKIVLTHKCGLSSNSTCSIYDEVYLPKHKDGSYIWNYAIDLFYIPLKSGKIKDDIFRIYDCGNN